MILLVDGSPGSPGELERLLRSESRKVTVVATAREALATLAALRVPPSVVACPLDARLPDGRHLLARLRDDDRLATVPAVVYARDPEPRLAALAATLDARAWFQLPGEAGALAVAVRGLAREGRGRHRRAPPSEQALGNEWRRRILEVLRDGEKSAGEVARVLGQRRPSLSHHLSELTRFGLVRCRREGPYRFYSLELDRVFAAWNDWLAGPTPATGSTFPH